MFPIVVTHDVVQVVGILGLAAMKKRPQLKHQESSCFTNTQRNLYGFPLFIRNFKHDFAGGLDSPFNAQQITGSDSGYFYRTGGVDVFCEKVNRDTNAIYICYKTSSFLLIFPVPQCFSISNR